MDKIDVLRTEIDSIDDKIMDLLDQRFFITKAIGEEKKKNSTHVLDSNRELFIFDKTSKLSHYPEIKQIYECIMNTSKAQQRK